MRSFHLVDRDPNFAEQVGHGGKVSESFRAKFGWLRRLDIAFPGWFRDYAGRATTHLPPDSPASTCLQSIRSQKGMSLRKRRDFIGGVEQGSGLRV